MRRINARDDFRGQYLGRHRLAGTDLQITQHGLGSSFYRRCGARVKFQVAELALDHKNTAFHVSLLQGRVGQRFNIEAGGHLDNLGRHAGAG